MRKARVVAEKGVAASYHCTTRVVERRCAFGQEEKEKFLEFLRDYEEFCGVQLLSFCVMSNHLHVLVHIPAPPIQMPDDAELVRLAARADVSYGAARLERDLATLRRANDIEGLEKLRKTFLCRMWNISKFMQAVKQRFTQWFNALHDRKGTLWEGRFKSVLVEDSERSLATMAAYIDLNPVRAGMVEDPAEYRWSGYGESVHGGALAQAGLKKVVMGYLASVQPDETPEQGTERMLARYRMYLFSHGADHHPAEPTPMGADSQNGDGGNTASNWPSENSQSGLTGKDSSRQSQQPVQNSDSGCIGQSRRSAGRKGIGRDRVDEVMRTGGRLDFSESIRCRNRYLTEGCVVGSREFVNRMFDRYRGHFGIRRKTGAREMPEVTLPEMTVIQKLRKPVIFSSSDE
jgi:putative transposase